MKLARNGLIAVSSISMLMIGSFISGKQMMTPKPDISKSDAVLYTIANNRVTDMNGNVISEKCYSNLGVSKQDVAQALDVEVVSMRVAGASNPVWAQLNSASSSASLNENGCPPNLTPEVR
jgi:hypothetical protein